MLTKKEIEIYKIDLQKLNSNRQKLERVKSYLCKREQRLKMENILGYFKEYEYTGIKIVDHSDYNYSNYTHDIYFYYLHMFKIYMYDDTFDIKRVLYDSPIGKDEVDGAIEFVLSKFRNIEDYMVRDNEGIIKHKEIYERYDSYNSIIKQRIIDFEDGMSTILKEFKSDIDEINSSLKMSYISTYKYRPYFCFIRNGKITSENSKKNDDKISKIKILSKTTKMFTIELISDRNVKFEKRVKKETFLDMISPLWYRWDVEDKNELLDIFIKYSSKYDNRNFVIN